MLIVDTGDRQCALPLEHAIETMRALPVETLAGAPAFLRGLAVIRGAPTPVVDLGLLLGDAGQTRCERFVTVRSGERTVALAVAGVVGVRDVESQAELPAPWLGDARAVRALAALDGGLVSLLKTTRLLPREVWQEIDRAGEAM